jgi:hypothetical protein
MLVYFNLTFSSLIEHRITTPATILPFALSFGLYIASLNYENRFEKTNNVNLI